MVIARLTVASALAALLVLLAVPARAASPIDLVVVIDQSGSMWGNPEVHPGKNDRWQHRIGATKQIVYRLIQNAADTGAVHRVSVVEFADEAKVALSGEEIRVSKGDPAAMDRLRARLETTVSAKDWGNTNTAAALEAALSELRGMRRSDPPGPRRRIVLLITDGRPIVPHVDNDTLRSRLRGHAAQLAAEGDELWVVGLNDADDYWTTGEGAFWEGLAGKDHARLAENASAAMPSIFQKVVDDWLGIQSRPVTGDEYECPPYLRRILFNVTYGRPGAEVKILDPDGNVVPRTVGGPAVAPGTFAQFAVDDPKPGKYAIVRDPSRSSTVYTELLSPAVERLEPRGQADAGVESPLVFQARRGSGDPLKPIAAYPIEASVVVTDALGNSTELPAKSTGDGRFAAAWKPARPGRYRAVLHGLVHLQKGPAYDIFANTGGSYSPLVDVGMRQPYSLRLLVPDPSKGLRTLPWRRSTALRWELVAPNGDAVGALAGLVVQPDSWLTVESLDRSGTPLGAPVALQPDAHGKFSASVPIDVAWSKGEATWSKPGALFLRVTAKPNRMVGERYLRSVVLPAGMEDRRIAGDPLSAGPLDVRLARWAWVLLWIAAAVCVAMLGWLLLGHWLPSWYLQRTDRAAARTVLLKVYDELKDPAAGSGVETGLTGRRIADMALNLEVDGSPIYAQRFRFVRELSDRRPRGTLRYRWRGNKRTYSTRLSAGNAKLLEGLPGGNYVALLVEQSQQ